MQQEHMQDFNIIVLDTVAVIAVHASVGGPPRVAPKRAVCKALYGFPNTGKFILKSSYDFLNLKKKGYATLFVNS